MQGLLVVVFGEELFRRDGCQEIGQRHAHGCQLRGVGGPLRMRPAHEFAPWGRQKGTGTG
jgi:hypothetical protein